MRIDARRLLAATVAVTALLAPSTAVANKATFKKARENAREMAQTIAYDSDGDDWGAGKCKRLSAHKVWCWSWIGSAEDSGSYGCRFKTVTVRSHTTGKYRRYTKPKRPDSCYV